LLARDQKIQAETIERLRAAERKLQEATASL